MPAPLCVQLLEVQGEQWGLRPQPQRCPETQLTASVDQPALPASLSQELTLVFQKF